MPGKQAGPRADVAVAAVTASHGSEQCHPSLNQIAWYLGPLWLQVPGFARDNNKENPKLPRGVTVFAPWWSLHAGGGFRVLSPSRRPDTAPSAVVSRQGGRRARSPVVKSNLQLRRALSAASLTWRVLGRGRAVCHTREWRMCTGLAGWDGGEAGTPHSCTGLPGHRGTAPSVPACPRGPLWTAGPAASGPQSPRLLASQWAAWGSPCWNLVSGLRGSVVGGSLGGGPQSASWCPSALGLWLGRHSPTCRVCLGPVRRGGVLGANCTSQRMGCGPGERARSPNHRP